MARYELYISQVWNVVPVEALATVGSGGCVVAAATVHRRATIGEVSVAGDLALEKTGLDSAYGYQAGQIA